MTQLRIALAQVNPTVGDIPANERLIVDAIAEAREKGADLVATPELAVCGYPPEDLLLNPSFLAANEAAVQRIAETTSGITALVGFPHRVDGKLHNAVAILQDGAWRGTISKMELPNYGVFDEKRYFTPGESPGFIALGEILVQVSICEDVWIPGNRIERAATALRPALSINISASPFHSGKYDMRRAILARFAAAAGCPLAYVNLLGCQDELVFDGGSQVIAPDGNTIAAAKRFAGDLLLVDLDAPARTRMPSGNAVTDGAVTDGAVVLQLALPERRDRKLTTHHQRPPARPETDSDSGDPAAALHEIRRALVLGTSDYVHKNGFRHVVIGLSGGIDSALVAALAVEALGPGAVTGVTMPSRHSSSATLSDAHILAANLGIPCLEIPIDDLYQHYLDHLAQPLGYDSGATPGLEAENLQARIRGNIIMTLSNRYGWMALTTGNKSELAMGYCTLYGDMAGGYAVLKDVYKTTVFALSRVVNREAGREIIPVSIIDRAPSAELRPDQKDEDSLPPYEILDAILKLYVEEDRSPEEIATATAADLSLVRDVIRKVDLNEYKRRQGPPGVRITPRNFSRDRRMPITNRWG